MAFLARTLSSLGRSVTRRGAFKELSIATPTTTTTAMKTALCRRNLTTTHQSPLVTQIFAHQQKRQQHTYQGDQDLASFLREEIELELGQQPSMPKLGNFKTSHDGTVVTLTDRQGDEKITISFDVNKSVNVPTDGEMGDDMDGGIVSYPEFQVSITKPSGRTLTFNCNTDAGSGMEEEEDDLQEENFRIESVQAYRAERGLDLSTIYEAEAENMDSNLHDMLLDILGEKGIDNEFVDGLIDLSTAVEHRLYVDHLKAMEEFAKE